MRLVIELNDRDAPRLEQELAGGHPTWLRCGRYNAQVRIVGPAPDEESAPRRAGRHVRQREVSGS